MKKISPRFIGLLMCVLIKSMQAQEIDPSTYFDISSSQKTISIDSLKEIYNREAISVDGMGHYMKNNKAFSLGFFHKKLTQELSKSKEGQIEIKLYNKMIIRDLFIYYGGFFGGAAILMATANPLGMILWIPAMVALVDLTKAPQHFQKAIWFYNRDVLIDKAKKSAE